jgi:hypothetical protein
MENQAIINLQKRIEDNNNRIGGINRMHAMQVKNFEDQNAHLQLQILQIQERILMLNSVAVTQEEI